MRRLFTATLLLAPLAAFAASPCEFHAQRNLQLDLAGVRTVQLEVHSYDLHVTGSDSSKALTLSGRACASDQSTLDGLQVTQRREGDQLLLDIGGNAPASISFFGKSYANLDVTVQLPASLPVVVNVGSGDADVSGLLQLQSNVGSGDLHARKIAGKLNASVGSGDVHADDIGSLDLGSAGSGDVKVAGIKGDATIGSIGSGDVDLRTVGGSVRADTLGSGDLTVSGVGGNFRLGAIGSGDVKHDGVKGKVSVPHDNDDD